MSLGDEKLESLLIQFGLQVGRDALTLARLGVGRMVGRVLLRANQQKQAREIRQAPQPHAFLSCFELVPSLSPHVKWRFWYTSQCYPNTHY